MPDSKKSQQKSSSSSQSSSSSPRTSASSPKQGQRNSSGLVVKDLQPRKDPAGGASPHPPKGDY